MTTKKKELFWFLGTALFVLISNLSLIGVKSFKQSSLDLHIADTYFVITLFPVVIFYTAITFFIVYFFRVIRNKFKNRTANMVFMVFTLILILALSKLVGTLGGIAQFAGMANSANSNSGISEADLNWAAILSNILIVIQFILGGLLIYTGVRTGKNSI